MLLSQMFPWLTELSFVSILIRLLLSVFCGGIIGMERERKGRPAGFRTHILVCMGAALVMMTNQYLFSLTGTGDAARLGAQVISGIGFLGAGTIIVTDRKQVRGLTTAAGLWASAAMGLAIGIGFYEAAILACMIIFFVERVLRHLIHKLDEKSGSARVVDLYIILADSASLAKLLTHFKENRWRIDELNIIKKESDSNPSVAVACSLYNSAGWHRGEAEAEVLKLEYVTAVEGM